MVGMESSRTGDGDGHSWIVFAIVVEVSVCLLQDSYSVCLRPGTQESLALCTWYPL